MNDRLTYALRLADDALVAAQRMSECITNSPQIEEDVAAANIALDLLGQARACYAYAGARDPQGRTEDDFAYLRTDREFTNAQLVELPNTDFAHTVVRGLALSGYQRLLYEALSTSCDAELAAIAAKAKAEVAYHFRHFSEWLVRLGDGTAESHERAAAALEAVWPYTHELFEVDPLTERLADAGVAPHPSALRTGFTGLVTPVLAQATLAVPEEAWRPTGGRSGRHTEAFGYLVGEMQSLARAHPGARW